MYNLIRHKVDFGLEACWTFTATGHGKSAGDGIGAVLKSTTRRATLSKNILLSTAKDFYEFCRNQQHETAKKSIEIVLPFMCSFLTQTKSRNLKPIFSTSELKNSKNYIRKIFHSFSIIISI